MKEKWIFYCDESGNTGTNWLNKEQPFFVYGGWLMDSTRLAECKSYFQAKFKIQALKEAKSSQFFKKKYAMETFREFFEKLTGEYNAFPIFAVVEKKYMLAAKVVETFFDSAYNPNVNWRMTYPSELKTALANEIYKMDDVLEEFEKVMEIKNLSIEHMEKIQHLLAKSFEESNMLPVAKSLYNLKTCNLAQMIEEFDYLSQSGNRKRWISLTVPTLIELLKNVELMAQEMNVEIDVIHDELSYYHVVFEVISNLYMNNGVGERLQCDGKIFLTRYPHINGITEMDSQQEIMIQMSDLLCGFINRSIGYRYDKIPVFSNTVKDMWEKLVIMHDRYVGKGICIWNYYSCDFEKRLLRNVGIDKTEVSNKWKEIIDREFLTVLNKG